MSLSAIFYPKVRLYESTYIPGILEEIYIKDVYGDLFRGKKDLTILDLGANCGITAQYFREFGKVYSCEPCLDQFEALSANKKFNEWDNVEIFNVAIADKDGEAMFHTNRSNMTAGSLDNPFFDAIKGGHNYDSGVMVKTVALDTFLEQNKIKSVDFMKLDVEGQETSILPSEGFKNIVSKIKVMMIEFHMNPGYEPLLELVKSFGFKEQRFSTDTVNYLFTR